MKSDNLDDNDPGLSALLRESRPAPPLPPRFQQEVWQRIERVQAAEATASPQNWFDSVLRRLLMPRFALAGAIALMVLSGFAGVLHGSVAAKDAARERYLASVAPSTIR